eukprot:1211539-Pyramimonas_sp.AAC.1
MKALKGPPPGFEREFTPSKPKGQRTPPKAITPFSNRVVIHRACGPSKSLSNGMYHHNGLASNGVRRVSMLKSNHAPVNSGDADRLDLDGDSEEDGDELVSPAILPAVAESAPPST